MFTVQAPGVCRGPFSSVEMDIRRVRHVDVSTSHQKRRTPSVVMGSFLSPPACFDETCQQTKDLLYVGSLLVPVGVFAAVGLAVLNRPNEATTKIESKPRWGEGKEYEVSDDDADDVARDSEGELCYRAVRYTPFLTEREETDAVFRLDVGLVGRVRVFENVVCVWDTSSHIVCLLMLPDDAAVVLVQSVEPRQRAPVLHHAREAIGVDHRGGQETGSGTDRGDCGE